VAERLKQSIADYVEESGLSAQNRIPTKNQVSNNKQATSVDNNDDEND